MKTDERLDRDSSNSWEVKGLRDTPHIRTKSQWHRCNADAALRSVKGLGFVPYLTGQAFDKVTNNVWGASQVGGAHRARPTSPDQLYAIVHLLCLQRMGFWWAWVEGAGRERLQPTTSSIPDL
eukprot:scaffold4555_cov255-Prasinococcus_capsulatus_cf.AAC.3